MDLTKKKYYAVSFTEMVEKLEMVGKLPRVNVKDADFLSGAVTITMDEGPPESFNEMMSRIKFIELVELLVIEKTNFDTGEIVVKVLSHSKSLHPTVNEVELICKKQTILAIKSLRQRAPYSIREAKKIVESWENRIFERNMKIF